MHTITFLASNGQRHTAFRRSIQQAHALARTWAQADPSGTVTVEKGGRVVLTIEAQG